jgi:hypothetical protein
MTVTFLACEESPTSIDALADAGTAPLLSADAGNSVVLSARGGIGSSTLKMANGQPNPDLIWRTQSFNVAQRADGSTTGQLQYKSRHVDPANTVTQHAVLTCVDSSLGEGVIVIAGYGTHRIAETDPASGLFGLPPYSLPDNDGIIFAIRDNGEGTSATGPDQFTSVLHTTIGAANAVCSNPAGFGFSAGLIGFLMNDADAGNIQVSQ